MTIMRMRGFQSTHPLRGATKSTFHGAHIAAVFQSTHPLRGATRSCAFSPIPLVFQSTHPLRGATILTNVRQITAIFQSTHPLRGATAAHQHHRGVRCISIHAPLAGCDVSVILGLYLGRVDFNPRTPCGVRLFSDVLSASRLPFQSTHPLRGATRRWDDTILFQLYFNPRTPCGVRPAVSVCARDVVDFNPRTPCGVRPAAGFLLSQAGAFQSTHPLRGATRWWICLEIRITISIHAPLAGCDSKNVQRKLHFF